MASEFTDLQAFRTTRDAARMRRDAAAQRLATHWDLLQDRHARGALLRDAASDALHSWGPYRKLSGLLHGKVNGSTLTALGSLYASTRPTFMKRLLFGGLSTLLGGLLVNKDEDRQNELLHSVARRVGAAVNVLRRHMDKARAAQEVR